MSYLMWGREAGEDSGMMVDEENEEERVAARSRKTDVGQQEQPGLARGPQPATVLSRSLAGSFSHARSLAGG